LNRVYSYFSCRSFLYIIEYIDHGNVAFYDYIYNKYNRVKKEIDEETKNNKEKE